MLIQPRQQLIVRWMDKQNGLFVQRELQLIYSIFKLIDNLQFLIILLMIIYIQCQSIQIQIISIFKSFELIPIVLQIKGKYCQLVLQRIQIKQLNEIKQNKICKYKLHEYGRISNINTHDLSTSNKLITRNHSLIILQFQRQISINQVNNLIFSITESLLLNIHNVTDT
ncbi:unnamed protein product [Paramecium sonneborni]|uniref:Transmembrane protein n=1 Tax=Paramecium sonneborni TaxID=65129 RepID=A0A8S1RTW5_9CILI|nr:unnamed protein product [Paramecium sonneborni]